MSGVTSGRMPAAVVVCVLGVLAPALSPASVDSSDGEWPCKARLLTGLEEGKAVKLEVRDIGLVDYPIVYVGEDTVRVEAGERAGGVRSFALADLERVSIRHSSFEPSWIAAGAFCGLVIGGLIYAWSDREQQDCSEISCSAPGLRPMLTGMAVGGCVGLVVAFLGHDEEWIECDGR